MNEVTFTALGMSGAGKTCYILGMYYDMVIGHNGLALATTGDKARMLEDWMDNLEDNVGMDRFPSGTSQANMTNYQFTMNYAYKPLLTVNWLDYPGGVLHARGNSITEFEQLNTSIQKSAALYIFLDGDNFCDENYKKKLRNVKREARIINDYLKKRNMNEGNLPPIVFVITKSDKYVQYISSVDEIEKIIEEAYASVFAKNREGCGEVYIVPVSLGNNIADDDYSGDADPINVHIPFLIGVYHNYSDICRGYAMDIDDTNRRTQMEIEAQHANQIKEENKIFFKRRERIDEYRRNIDAARADIAGNEEKKKNYFKLLRAVSDELLRESRRNGFTYFCDGKKRDFIPRD